MKGKRKTLPPWQRSTPFKGVAIAQIYRGQLHWQKWPRKRGRPRSLKLQELNAKFADAQLLARFADPWAIWMAHEIARHGPIYPRDVHVSAMYGRLFEVLNTDEGAFYSMALVDDISGNLDIVGGAAPGTILVRGEQRWIALLPGDLGHVLTSQGDDTQPLWQPGGGAGATFWTQPNIATTADGNSFSSRGIAFVPRRDFKISQITYRLSAGVNGDYTCGLYELDGSNVIQSVVARPATQHPGVSASIFLDFDLDPAPTLTKGTRYFLCASLEGFGDTNNTPYYQTSDDQLPPNLDWEMFTLGTGRYMHARLAKAIPAVGHTVSLTTNARIWFGLLVTG